MLKSIIIRPRDIPAHGPPRAKYLLANAPLALKLETACWFTYSAVLFWGTSAPQYALRNCNPGTLDEIVTSYTLNYFIMNDAVVALDGVLGSPGIAHTGRAAD
jgi:hypothetical protein